MASSSPVDARADPTAAIQDIYNPAHNIDDFPARVAKYFTGIFSSPGAFEEIPVLSVKRPPGVHEERSLVRFRGMVQDTSYSPEIYLARRSNGRCGGWGLAEDNDDSGGDVHYPDLRECSVIWAVSIPGETSWCTAELDGIESAPVQHSSVQTQGHKNPIPGIPHVGVQVKIYDNTHAEMIRATDILTFVGILTSEPFHVDLDLPAVTLVPTLHVLYTQPLPITVINRSPILREPVKALREDLIDWIADEGLAGDREAAEWVLLCIIARCQSRNPPIIPPSLTISHFPPADTSNATPTISHIISLIQPMLTTLPMSLPVINTTNFFPESRQEDLHSGWLQLPKGSTCIITEGGVNEGSVAERGIMNLRAIQKMMSAQTLEYVFPFSRFEFETDVSMVVICEGRKSAFFQTNINIPLQASDSPELQKLLYKPQNEIKLPPLKTLQNFRHLVGGAKVGTVTVGENVAQYIQDDFVTERKTKAQQGEGKNGEAISAEDLIHRMLIARLMTLSVHEPDVSVEIWEKTKALDARRRGRLDGSNFPV
ncbi:mini-chromosome maintenance replisome factor-domain-containing protein [Infundibulicybe gibba]|nr:mini-chromosome maintenance replisome factor-domain-containing protein [Infundibulicybe gibba]